MTRPAWAPMVGFSSIVGIVPGSNEAVALAASLEVVRREVCAYIGSIEDGDVACDCKYGAGRVLTEGAPRRPGTEKTGCPELRGVIAWLLGTG